MSVTTLSVINAMLAATGTSPVTVQDTQHPAYIKALNKLTSVSVEVQGMGWWYNTATRTLVPDVTGVIILPANTLSADPVDRKLNYVVRKNRVYDLNGGTNIIGVPVELRIIEAVDIIDAPPTAQTYIRATAVHSFYVDQGGTEPKLSEYRSAAAKALVYMKAENLRAQDVNAFDSPSFQAFRRHPGGNRLPT